MDTNINKLKPSELWGNFYKLTQIPRPSKNEELVIEFAKKFGENLGLQTTVDQIGNVIIKKPATKGMENRKGIILQAHLDMVPQKNSDKEHDFKKDAIQAYIDGDWVTANGTTLGADNGIGAAAAMAVLESKDLQHGPIEALLTIDEETGMTGAFGLKGGLLDGDILLNLDSEDEGELYIGCAGGVDTTAYFDYKLENVPANNTAYKVSVKGLKGGHSGIDIILKRGNANKILNSVLKQANDDFGIFISDINGGNLRNAIPREAVATIVIEESKLEALKEIAAKFEEKYKKQFDDDLGLVIVIEQTEMPKQVIDADTTKKLFSAIEAAPNGVVKMNEQLEGVVETSSNMAMVKTQEGKLMVGFLHRSSSEDEKKEICKVVRNLFEKYGATVSHTGDYPGWQPNAKSAILETMKKIYKDKFGKIPEVKVIHAGLECGILSTNYPHWDMISFGPTIRSPHSPDEKVNIETVELFWTYLVETLKAVPNK